MILEWFVAFITGLVGSLADYLPTWDLPTGLDGALSFALTLNGVVPAAEFIGVGTMLLGLYVVLFVYRLVKIIVSHVPLVGGDA